MKKMDQKKNKFNVAISKNSYCITLKNAGKRTQGGGGFGSEGSRFNRQRVMHHE